MAVWLVLSGATLAQFDIRQLANETFINREPAISDTGLVAWQAFRVGQDAASGTDIYVHQNGETISLTEGAIEPRVANNKPQVSGEHLVWTATITERPEQFSWKLADPPLDASIPEPDARFRVGEGSRNEPDTQIIVRAGDTNFFKAGPQPDAERAPRRTPSGDNEIMYWSGGDIVRISADDRNDLAPALSGNLLAWQKARGWPYGWEIMAWADGERMQLTTNYYYEMAPQVQGDQVVWYGWDGTDYEIYLYDHAAKTITQITDNEYDDVSPRIANGTIVWEGFPAAHAEIFMWQDGTITQLSNNPEDDINPRIWNGEIVWQGFDGDFFQVFHFDGTETRPLTNTRYDNINPQLGDGLIVWMGYVDNLDAEIFAWNGGPDPIRLTDNEHEDQHPRTAGGSIVWQADFDGKSHIYLAEPQ